MVSSLERSYTHIYRQLFVSSWLYVHAVSTASPADIIINQLFKGPQSMGLCHLLHDLHNYCCETDRQDFQPDRRDTETHGEEIQRRWGWKWVLAFFSPGQTKYKLTLLMSHKEIKGERAHIPDRDYTEHSLLKPVTTEHRKNKVIFGPTGERVEATYQTIQWYWSPHSKAEVSTSICFNRLKINGKMKQTQPPDLLCNPFYCFLLLLQFIPIIYKYAVISNTFSN